MLATSPMQGCRPLNAAEVVSMTTLFSSAERYRDLCLFVLGVSCGFRVSEMLALRVRDVWQNDKVVDWLIIKQTKTDEIRQVQLGKDDKQVLELQVRSLRQAGFYHPGTMLFRSREGRNQAMSRTRAWQIIHDTARGLGMGGKIGTHSMRKTFANDTFQSFLDDVAAGVSVEPLLETQRAGGWKSLESCKLYLSFRTEHQQRAKRKAQGKFGELPEVRR